MEQKWIIINQKNVPEEGIDCLLYDKSWISENNPKGIRKGFFYDNGFVTCEWDSNDDSYRTDEINIVPFAYMNIPTFKI